MRRVSVGAQLGILTASLALLAVAFSVLMSLVVLDLVDRRAEESARTLAQASALALGHLMADGEDGLRSIARLRGPISEVEGCEERMAVGLAMRSVFLELIELDPDGEVRCTLGELEPRSGLESVLPDLSRRLQGTDDLSALPPVRVGEGGAGAWVVPLAVPLGTHGGEAPAGALIGLVGMDNLQDLLRAIPLPEEGIVTVVDIPTSRIVARSVDPEGWIGRTLELEGITPEGARQGGTIRLESLDDVDRIWGFEPIPRLDWSVNVGLPVAWIRAPVWDAVGVSALLILSLFFLAVVFADWIRRSIVGAIGTLIRQSQAAAAGRGSEIRVTGPPEIEELAAAFNRTLRDRASLDARVRQAEKLRSVGRLAAGIAHEFRNRLTVITGEASLLALEGRGDPEAEESVERIQEAAQGASELTGKLLAVGERAPERIEEVRPSPAVRKELRLAALALGEEYTLDASIEKDVPPVRCGPEALGTILRELVDNAVDAMPDGGSIRVSLRSSLPAGDRGEPLLSDPEGEERERWDGPGAVLEVEDEGRGIDPKDRGQIYEPFFTTKEGATGLGLSTVRGLVRQAGGRIVLRSRLGEGTRVRIFFRAAGEGGRDAGEEG